MGVNIHHDFSNYISQGKQLVVSKSSPYNQSMSDETASTKMIVINKTPINSKIHCIYYPLKATPKISHGPNRFHIRRSQIAPYQMGCEHTPWFFELYITRGTTGCIEIQSVQPTSTKMKVIHWHVVYTLCWQSQIIGYTQTESGVNTHREVYIFSQPLK